MLRLPLLFLSALLLPFASSWLAPMPAEPVQSNSRRAVMAGGLATVLAVPSTARAASKYDKAFDECLSKCVYEKTKVKTREIEGVACLAL